MNNSMKKTAVVMLVFAFLGSPFGALCMWLCTLFWTAFNHPSDALTVLGTAPVIVFMALFSYVVGLVPALLAGALFSVWYVRQEGSPPLWTMAVIGFTCGGGLWLVLQLHAIVEQSTHWAGLSDGLMAFFIYAGAGALCALVVDVFQADA